MSKLFEKTTEIVGWLQIVVSSAILSFFVGCFIYFAIPNSAGLGLGIIVTILGLILGIFYATRKFKTTGTIDLISRVSATPELDKTEKEETND